MSDQTTPNEIPAGELEPRQHVVVVSQGTPTVAQIEHALPYRDGDGREMVAVTLSRPGGGEPIGKKWPVGELVDLATDDEVADAEARGRRLAAAAELHRLADDIVAMRLPVGSNPFNVGPGVLDSRADLERWAAYWDTEITMSGRIPIVRAQRPIADGLKMVFHTQSPSEPKPVALDPVAGAESSAEHYFHSGWDNGPGACGALCKCGTSVDGFDSIAEATKALGEHIDDQLAGA